jgi:hypothetical protein
MIIEPTFLVALLAWQQCERTRYSTGATVPDKARGNRKPAGALTSTGNLRSLRPVGLCYRRSIAITLRPQLPTTTCQTARVRTGSLKEAGGSSGVLCFVWLLLSLEPFPIAADLQMRASPGPPTRPQKAPFPPRRGFPLRALRFPESTGSGIDCAGVGQSEIAR